MTNLAPGAYTVQVELSGFGNQTREVVLGVGQVETVNLTLAVAGRTQAVTPLLSGFPEGTVATSNPLVALLTQSGEAEQQANTLSIRYMF